jgi:TolB protein
MRRLPLLVLLCLFGAVPAAEATPTLVYVSQSSPGLTPEAFGYGVVVAEADGTSAQRLTRGCGDLSSASWSPSGTRIAFANGPAASPCVGSEIYTMNRDGTGVTAVTSAGRDSEFPDFSPSGTRIVYDQGDNRYSHPHDIWVSNTDGTGATQLTSGPLHDDQPHFSPDGSTILFSRSTGSADARTRNLAAVNLWAMDADGTNERPLTVGGGFLSGADYSPDGRSITFSNNGRIYTMGVDGTSLTPRTDGPATTSYYDVEPSWTPDGNSIVFQRVRRGACDECGYSIGRVSLPSGTVTTLVAETTTPWQFNRPSLWAPAIAPASLGADHAAPVTVLSGTTALDASAVLATGSSAAKTDPSARRRSITARRDRISFMSVDRSGVRGVAMAIHTPARGGRCRALSGGKLGASGACSPRFNSVGSLKKLRNLVAKAPKGSYVFEVRATDRRGNASRTTPVLVKLR